ncbi:MAG: hypothetical protein ACK5RL_08240 [Acidimicrobiales bacterium]
MTPSRLALRLLRHYRRETAIVVALVAVAVAALSALEIARVGINDANHQTMQARYSGRSGVGSLIDPADAPDLVALEGRGVDPVWFQAATVERERRSVDATVATVVSPGIEMGHYDSGRPPVSEAEVAVSAEVAESLGLGVGDPVDVLDRTRTVSGVYLFPSQPRATELFLVSGPDQRPADTPDLYLVTEDAVDQVLGTLRVIPIAIHLEDDVFARNGDQIRHVVVVTGSILWLVFVLVTLGVLVRLGRARGPDLTGMVAGGMRSSRVLGVFRRAGAIAVAAGGVLGYLVAATILHLAPDLVASPAGQRWATTPWWSPRLVAALGLFALAMILLGQARIWIPQRVSPVAGTVSVERLVVALIELGAGTAMLILARRPTSLVMPVMLLVGMLLIVDAVPGVLGALRRRVYGSPVAKVLNRVDPLAYGPTRLAVTGLALVGLSSVILQTEALVAGVASVPAHSLVVRDLAHDDGDHLLQTYGDRFGGSGVLLRTPDDTGGGMLRVISSRSAECLEGAANIASFYRECTDERGQIGNIRLPAVDSSWTSGANFDQGADVWYAADYILGDSGRIGLVTIDAETNDILALETVPAQRLDLLSSDILPAAVAPMSGTGVPADAVQATNGSWTLLLEGYTELSPADQAAMQYELTRRASYGLANGDFGDELGFATIARVMWIVGLVAMIGSLVLWTADVKATNREVAELTASEQVPRRRRIIAVAHVTLPVAVAGSVVTFLGLYVGSRVTSIPVNRLPVWPAVVAPIVIVATIIAGLRPRWRPATPGSGPRLAGRAGAVVVLVAVVALVAGCASSGTGDEQAVFLDKARNEPGYLEGVADGYALTFQDHMVVCMATGGFDYRPDSEEVALSDRGDPAVDGLKVSTTHFNVAALDGSVLGSEQGGVGAPPAGADDDALGDSAQSAYFDAFDVCEAEAHETALAAHPEVTYLFALEQVDARGPQQDLEDAVLRCLAVEGYDFASVDAIRQELSAEVSAIETDALERTDAGPRLTATGIDELAALQAEEQAVAVQLDTCGWFAPTEATRDYWDEIDRQVIEELNRLTAPS